MVYNKDKDWVFFFKYFADSKQNTVIREAQEGLRVQEIQGFKKKGMEIRGIKVKGKGMGMRRVKVNGWKLKELMLKGWK